MKYTHSLIFVLITLSQNCNHQENREGQKEFEDSIAILMSHELHLPDSLMLFNEGHNSIICTKNYLENEIKILSIIENDCRNCTISQLLFWDSFMMEYDNQLEFQLVLIYCGPDEYLRNVLLDELGVKLPLLFDTAGIILKNELFANPEYRTVLLDKENKVCLIGDFSENKQLEDLYLEEIKQQLY